MTRLSKLGPIGPEHAARLAACGCRTHIDLLEQGASEAGRQRLAAAAGVPPERIHFWVRRADLAQVKGIGDEYADLLAAAGVTTTAELAQCSADELHARLGAINAERGLVRVVPSLGQVEKWLMGARALPHPTPLAG